jgi:hypothetical protein
MMNAKEAAGLAIERYFPIHSKEERDDLVAIIQKAIDDEAAANFYHTTRTCDDYDEFGHPIDPECELPKLANRVHGIMAEQAEKLTALQDDNRRLREAEKKQGANFPKIVCLCGSTRFMNAFFETGWDETLKGNIVLSVGVCKHVGTEGGHGAEMLGQDVADALDELHFRKIDLANEVIVLRVGGYIGKSTSKEIKYAESCNKPIRYVDYTAALKPESEG